VLGTRFLLTEESGAHPDYKRRLLDARDTVLTELFSMGWFGRTRVIWNEAAERWLTPDEPLGPSAVRLLNRAAAPLLARLPDSLQSGFAGRQDPSRPFFGPMAATRDGPAKLVEAGPLYAGESVARIDDLGRAGPLTRELAG
jgi:NAD(P)H-dependent flavin oxidoreductase YrpB (nitropropane dioxygenase family)